MASTVPAKSQSLHNFALPRLKWNNNNNNNPRGGDAGTEQEASGKGKLIAEFKSHAKNCRENLNVFDNKGNDKEARSRILIKIPALMRNNKEKEKENQVRIDDQNGFQGGGNDDDDNDDDEPVAKIWNLRPRRPTKKFLNVSDGFVQEKKKNQLQKENLENGTRVRVESRLNGFEKAKKVKFSISLTRQEIEEDIYSLTGSKAARRPRKRAKLVQKNLDNVFPGLWLGSITHDLYKVSDH